MRGIAFKLWAGMMLLVASVLLLLWFFQILFLEKFYINERVSEVNNKGFYIAENISSFQDGELENELDSLVYNYNSSVELTDSNGKLLYNNFEGRQPLAPNNITKMNLLRQILSGDSVISKMKHQRFNTDYILLGIPVKVEQKIIGALIISMPLPPIHDTVEILKKQLVYILGILMVVSILLSYLLSKVFVKPIMKIINVTEEMASGHLDVKIETKSKDEIGRLTNSINHLGAELSKIEKLRREFIANVSHDLRTPLSLIRGYAETIKDVTGSNQQKREKQLDIIIEESERLSKIVEDILYLSQMQKGNMRLSISNFDIVETVKNVVKRYEILSQQKGIAVEFSSVDKVTVSGDKGKIEQVLYNVINNSFNHTKEGDKVSVVIDILSDKVKIQITDTGEGIRREDLDRIWERYYRTLDLKDKKSSGTGLGLAIVKSILAAHKSKFGVFSEEDKGTTFWFDIEKSN